MLHVQITNLGQPIQSLALDTGASLNFTVAPDLLPVLVALLRDKEAAAIAARSRPQPRPYDVFRRPSPQTSHQLRQEPT